MKTINCSELAESFINGNISYVRNKLLGNSKVALVTADFIKENYGEEEYKKFVRLMLKA